MISKNMKKMCINIYSPLEGSFNLDMAFSNWDTVFFLGSQGSQGD